MSESLSPEDEAAPPDIVDQMMWLTLTASLIQDGEYVQIKLDTYAKHAAAIAKLLVELRDLRKRRAIEPRAHKWDADGEHCIVCGASDWMAGGCSPKQCECIGPCAASLAIGGRQCRQAMGSEQASLSALLKHWREFGPEHGFDELIETLCSKLPPETSSHKTITPVFIICNAYESGFGHGRELDKLPNPYSEGSEEHEAYKIGYDEGEDRRRSNGSTAHCNEGRHKDCRLESSLDCMCRCHLETENRKPTCALVGCDEIAVAFGGVCQKHRGLHSLETNESLEQPHADGQPCEQIADVNTGERN